MFSQIISGTFVRFLIVGVFNTIFGYSVYWILLRAGIDYKFSVFLATIAGILFNYRTIGTFVFMKKKSSILRFIAVYIVLYFVNVLGIYLLFLSGFDYAVGGFLMTAPAAFLGFLLNRKFVYG